MNERFHIVSNRASVSALKLRLFLAGILIMAMSGTVAQTSLLDKEVALPALNTNVEGFLKFLGTAGGFTFSYGHDIPLQKQVETAKNKQSVRDFLDEVFKGDSVQYVEKTNKILIISTKKAHQRSEIQQSLRGIVVDKDTQVPLAGANIVIASDAPLKGTISGPDGQFKLDKIPVGRHDVKVTYVGYEPVTFHNILVGSGKEQLINVAMEEQAVDIEGVEIFSNIDRVKPINDMTMISARSFSAQETENYPGALNDVSRAAMSFPGVLSNNDGQNHLIIRGNSPKGLQWRLEGIEIPNLNHFAEIGSSGGGIGILSSNMLAPSDFMSGAFPAEYGNALSGVFDLKMRQGNNEKHEQTFEIGMIGTELMIEGPLKKNTNKTYLAQYRYSTFMLIEKMGINLSSIPEFQDLSFKFFLPTKKMGTFSIFGIGGKSREIGDSGYDWRSDMATFGISHNYIINPKTLLTTIIALSGWKYSWDDDSNIGTYEQPIDYQWNSDVTEYSTRISSSVTHKFNTRHKIKAGIVFDYTFYDSYMGWHSDTLYNWSVDPDHPQYGQVGRYEYAYSDDEGGASTFQAYGSWKYRIRNNLSVNTGLHYIQLYLNNNFSIEPRFGLDWQFLPKHALSAGFGLHSRKESLTLYTGQKTLHDGAVVQLNTDLELTKSMHYILGYNYSITESLLLKTEAYYQYLYDIPVYPFPPYFSSINFDYGFEGNILVNEGTGTNMGIEVSLEKFFARNYYFIINGTIYDSKFKNYLGEEYHTKYDGSYAANALIIKEFDVGKFNQNQLALSMRTLFIGGMRYLPIDLEQSIEEGRQVVIWDHGFTEKASDYLRFDFQIRYKINKPKYSSEIRLDIINITNRKNMLDRYYDDNTQSIVVENQNPIIPFLTYKIMF